MTYVNITALTFPEGAEAEIERRFAARKRGVDASQGFQGFELLRPVVGEDRYFVVTRWDRGGGGARGPPAGTRTTGVGA